MLAYQQGCKQHHALAFGYTFILGGIMNISCNYLANTSTKISMNLAANLAKSTGTFNVAGDSPVWYQLLPSFSPCFI